MSDTVLGLSMVAVWIGLQTPLFILARRLRALYPWQVFVPFLCVFPILRMARLSTWWFLACIVPYLGFIALAYTWSRVLDRLNRSRLWALVLWIPVINSVPLAVFAFAKDHPLAAKEIAT